MGIKNEKSKRGNDDEEEVLIKKVFDELCSIFGSIGTSIGGDIWRM